MWNSEHAARRYFRRKGATIDPKNKVVIINQAIDMETGGAYRKHFDAMKAKKYDISNSLFLNLD